MAKYEIQAPNGDLYEIEGPEDATDEQLAEVVAQILTPGVSTDPTEGMGRWDRFSAGFGKAYTDIGRGVQQAALSAAEINPAVRIGDYAARALGGEGALAPIRARSAGLSAQEAEARERDSDLMGTGWGRTGYIGGQASTIIAPGAGLAATGSRLAPALLPTTIRGAAAQGAVLGAAQPVVNGGTERAQNAAIGAVAGAAGQGIVNALGAGIRGAGRVLQPFTRAGQERIVGRLLTSEATDPATLARSNPSAVPGVQRTLAEEVADPGISQLQRQFPAELANQASSNNRARAEAIRSAFEGARKADADAIIAQANADARAYTSGLAELPPVSAPDILGTLEQQLFNSAGRPTVQGPLNAAREQIIGLANQSGEINPAAIYNVRKFIGDMIEGRAGGDLSSSRVARRQLVQVKNAIDAEMTRVFPRWRQYLTEYAAEARRADQARVGSRILAGGRHAVDPRTGERALTPEVLARAANEPDALVQRATGNRQATAAALTAEQRALISALGDDAGAMVAARDLGRAAGSPTAQNLATQNVIRGFIGDSRIGRALSESAPAQGLTSAADKVYSVFGVPERLKQITVEALSNPAEARRILARLPPADRRIVQRVIARASTPVAIARPED